MKIRALAAVLAAFSLLSLAACEGETPSLEKAQDVLKKASETAEKASGYLENLDTEAVNKFAVIAAGIEKEPAKAEQLLKDAGISRENFDAAVKKIEENPEMKELFDAAKAMAAKATETH